MKDVNRALKNDGSIDYRDDMVWHVNTDHPDNLPLVTYEDFEVKQSYNAGSRAYDRIVTNSSGESVDEVWREYRRMQIDFHVEAPSEGEKEEFYDTIRNAFIKYIQWASPDDLHDHCIDVDVEDSTSPDLAETSKTIRADRIQVFVEYYREVERFGSRGKAGFPMRKIDSDIDGNDYTTS